MSAWAWIESVSFISTKCYYCDNPWEYRLEVEPIDSKTKELTGKTVDIYVCQECRNTRLTAFEDRIRSITPKKDRFTLQKECN